MSGMHPMQRQKAKHLKSFSKLCDCDFLLFGTNAMCMFDKLSKSKRKLDVKRLAINKFFKEISNQSSNKKKNCFKSNKKSIQNELD